jgi:DNA repair exonuclease SbcCD ATPase subunit
MMETFDTNSRIAVLENEIKNIASDIKEIKVDQKEQHDALMKHFVSIEERLSNLEKWRWMVVGGAMVIGFLLSNVSKLLAS